MKPQLMIGAASSGSGKTTFTMGILRALKNRGLKVQPYKCGPDYIDTKFHTLASGNESVNLDTWLGSENHVRKLYQDYGNQADVCVVEGVMGLFDGHQRMQGSSAELAGLLDIPVILLVNAKSTAYSVAPLICGFKNFSPMVWIAGVVFNQVSSTSHYEHLKAACQDVGVECLGYLPFSKDLKVPSRHLGLSLGAKKRMDEQIARTAELIARYVDLDRLLECCQTRWIEGKERSLGKGSLKIVVAKDAAFNFIYRENISSLRRLGKVEFFSPLEDTQLPECDLLYLPGGYPELYLERLRRNVEMRRQISDYIENGGKCWAECGGMMYLCSSISDEQGREYEMCGVLGQKATMVGKRLQMGYRRFSYAGRELRGHEFHYSRVVPDPGHPLQSIAQLYNAAGNEVATPLYRYRNLIAGYTHLYWGNMNLLELF